MSHDWVLKDFCCLVVLLSSLACSSAEPPPNREGATSGATATGGAGSGGVGQGAGGIGSNEAGGVAGQSSAGAASAGGASLVDAGGGGGITAGGASAGAASGGGDSASPAVRIVGRAASNGADLRFGWPGVALHARFRGTRASIHLNDGNRQNAFAVVVDDSPPQKFRTSSGQSSYPLAADLPDAEHRVVVWKSTEAFDTGNVDFLGFGEFGDGGAALLSPPSAPERRIEVIGDSISVGAGLEGGPANCAANKSSTDNYYAYGSVAARALGADLVTIAYSGIGVYRSYGSGDPTMPQRYDRALPGDDGDWDFSKYQPHVVVITLGTNDFGAGNPGQAYVDAYVSFFEEDGVRNVDASGARILTANTGLYRRADEKAVT